MPFMMTSALFSYASANRMILHYCTKRLFSVVSRLSICLEFFLLESYVSVVKKVLLPEVKTRKTFPFFSKADL